MLGTIVIAVVLISLLSLLGAISLAVNEEELHKWMLYVVAFAAGTMLGASFFNLLPRSVEALDHTGFTWALVGVVAFFIMERFVFWHHCHTHNHEVKPYTYLNLVGDGVHNFVDGAIIAAAFLTNFELGVVTTIAIAMHEIPQELGDFAILVHGGFSTKKALGFNFLSAVTAVVGGVLMYYLSSTVQGLIPVFLGIASGGFVYVATADLIPELQDEENFGKMLIETIILILGVLLIFGVKNFVH